MVAAVYRLRMSMHRATIEWQRAGGEFARKKFSRVHRWTFDGGVEVPAGASPEVVPLPWTSAAGVDPEEAFVAALSSCHLMSFLFEAANDGWVIEAYVDRAEGTLRDGWVQEVVLRPEISFAGRQPSGDEIAALHARAHAGCFVARSVKSSVRVEAGVQGPPLSSLPQGEGG
jgi:organic hydroperoxide reductase OsmC/OhrA